MPMPAFAIPLKAVEARVRRRILSRDGEILRKARGGEWGHLGPYFTVDSHSGNVLRNICDSDFENLARECGALPPWAFIREE